MILLIEKKTMIQKDYTNKGDDYVKNIRNAWLLEPC